MMEKGLENDEQDVFEEKKLRGYIIVNWWNCTMRLRKTYPQGIGPNEIPVCVNLTVQVPAKKTTAVDGTVKVPRAKVREKFVEGL